MFQDVQWQGNKGWPTPYAFDAQAEYAHPGIQNQQNIWARAASQGLGIPVEWSRTSDAIKTYTDAMNAVAQAKATTANAGLPMEIYQGGPMGENPKFAFERLQQQGPLSQIGLKGQLQTQAGNTQWDRLQQMLGQLLGIGGGGVSGGTSGGMGGGMSPIASSISSLDLSPIHSSADEMRRRLQSGGSSAGMRRAQMADIGGSELSGIAQAIIGKQQVGAQQGTDLTRAIMALLGQMSPGQMSF